MTEPTTAPEPTRLADYQPPAWEIATVELTFGLDPERTRVRAKITYVPGAGGDLVLDGTALETISATIDGRSVSGCIDGAQLVVPQADLPVAGFVWEAETEINPSQNTALEGLYLSDRIYCTQCEAEGFRRITWFPDRPDVMARYKVRIESDAPVLLSNGDLVAQGPGWAEWSDPHPKPCYLFALVAGDLRHIEDQFTTASGRAVTLRIYTNPGDEDRCAYAMDALKRSMCWDEQVYGLEYDLDLFNIVAVEKFNAGAMENKGLNIFNSALVLASPESATDQDYARIESVIAHEYFHNWSGNRVTCRDWFQLSLKEGLTVYRDQCFSEDMRPGGVTRIKDVALLRAAQFREDQGPLAHPVRPREYIRIDNFYTATIYEKGAEVIRMLHLLVGDAAYRKATDLYFARHDGQACTIEQWLAVFEETTGRDLSQFARWYDQAGTPTVTVQEQFEGGRYRLTLRQETPPTPGQPQKEPLVIPIAYGLIDADGTELAPPGVLELTEAAQSWSFDLPRKPIASLLRGFSAPVTLVQPMPRADRVAMLAHDRDPFNRWDAGRRLALDCLDEMTRGKDADPALLDALTQTVCDPAQSPAFRAEALALPSAETIAADQFARTRQPDPDAIYAARERLANALAAHMQDRIAPLYDSLAPVADFSADAVAAGQRALRQLLLGLLSRTGAGSAPAQTAYANATTMSESLGALAILIAHDAAKDALDAFYARWKNTPTVLDKWFSVQVAHCAPHTALARAETLCAHPDFSWQTPNRFRALIGGFSGNFAAFNAKDGAGYRFVANWIGRLDRVNPYTASGMLSRFETWPRFDADRREAARSALSTLAAQPDLSPDSREMLARLLGKGEYT